MPHQPAGIPQPADATADRDPQRPARLLRTEYDALLPILQRTPEPAFDRPTACPGWSVRDVLAHCGAALTRVAAITCGRATLMRRFTGRPAGSGSYHRSGVTAAELVVF